MGIYEMKNVVGRAGDFRRCTVKYMCGLHVHDRGRQSERKLDGKVRKLKEGNTEPGTIEKGDQNPVGRIFEGTKMYTKIIKTIMAFFYRRKEFLILLMKKKTTNTARKDDFS